MRITIELSRRSRRVAAGLTALILLAVPAIALANHQYNDVPANHPFHSEISAVTRAGIAAGFQDGGFHPGDPVTRQAMGAFLQRGLGRVGLSAGSPPSNAAVTVAANSSTSDTTLVRDVTITVPGASNGFTPKQLVHLRGDVQFDTSMHGAKGCPCEFEVWIYDSVDLISSWGHLQTFESTVNAAYGYVLSDQAVFAVPPGQRTFRLAVKLIDRANPGPAATFDLSIRSSLSASTFAFGPSGTNTTN